ncbi:MAG: ParB N-terminal domain-containing protein [Deltaproteobacteria bacterium]|nr:ParB N-terminal domain-containing protein [Deltaproteobacteria bacterium]
MTEAEVTASVSVDQLDERYGYLRIPKPRQENAVGESMRRFGQLTPVVAAGRDDGSAVVDGFKRLHGARKIGIDRLEVRVLSLSEQAAVAAVYSLNRYGCGMTDLEEALVVRALCRKQGLAQVEVAELLGRHKSWVSRRLMLIERLHKQVQEDIRVGLLSVSAAREIARLPRGNQPEAALCIHRNGLTVREASLLVTLFEKATDRTEQQALLDRPRDALDRHCGGPAVAVYDSRLSAQANRLRRLLLSVSEGTCQLSQTLSDLDASQFEQTETSALMPLFQRTQDSVSQLCEALASLEFADVS